MKLLFDKWYYELENGELTFSYKLSVGNQGMEKNIIGLIDEIINLIKKRDYEIIVVDDGSTDSTVNGSM